ncbi:MAG: type I restriction enzyme HsdR N-terminal domain-containing protein [Bacteroidota bacterium]
MIPLDLPQYAHRMKKENSILRIYDIIRKKYVILTPEEWVRQQFVHWLLEVHRYPKALMRVETGLKYNQRQKRTDLVIYNREGIPFVLVECKSMKVTLNQQVCEQAAQYNTTLKAPYIIITNGYFYQTFYVDQLAKKAEAYQGIPQLT